MAFDWLFGPARTEHVSLIELRSLVLDIEIVETIHGLLVELVEKLDALWEEDAARAAAVDPDAVAGPYTSSTKPSSLVPAEVRLYDYVRLGEGRQISIESVAGRLKADRERLGLTGGGVTVLFARDRRPHIAWDAQAPWTQASSLGSECAREIADLLIRNGRPRPRLRNWRAYLPVMGGLATFAAWVWLAIAGESPAPLVVFSGLVAVLVLLGSFAWATQRRMVQAGSHPGIRFREASRADLRVQLARVKANILVGSLSTLLGVVLTLLIQGVVGAGPLAP